MPVIVNICANLLFGAALVLAVRRSPAMRDAFLSWSLFFLIAFEAVVFTPVATFLFRFYPQWSMLYWFDPQIFPELDLWFGWLSALAVLLNFGAALLGYFLARLGVITGQAWLWSLPLAASAAAIAYVAFSFGERLVFIGDYDAFWQGNAQLMFSNLVGWIGVLCYIGTGAFVVWTHRRFHDHDPSLL
jgi:hypothetical protein